MNDLTRIHAAYIDSDNYFSSRESNAKSDQVRNEWAIKRMHNDTAYFTLLFSQFEHFVDQLCEQLVSQKKSLDRWGDRRSWQLIDSKTVDKLDFNQKIILLMDKEHELYRVVSGYSHVKTRIDHGDISNSISVTAVKDDLYEACKVLKKYVKAK
ncbi:MAG: hypothetical protein HRT89_07975 [Lentisphaeria bacterium]|nr:hypothetical protein [Lentisphaeria bacterium]